MKKQLILTIILVSVMLFMPRKVYAYSASDYEYRNLCGNYEIASFKADGSVSTVACHSDFYVARNDMRNRGGEDLAILSWYNGKVKILDANAAILDMTQNGGELTYFFDNYDLSGYSYTYIYGGSGYGGVDGAYLDSAWSERADWTVKVKIANYTGWISMNAVEIVPLPWVHSNSSYTVTNDSIRHNYVYKVQDYYYGSSGSTIGPKPEMLNSGTYYSYDGHYFYSNLSTMLKDYKNGNYNNAVNKNKPYYNYYMYLSNHTKTTYSSNNIDEYIRNNLGYTRDTYGNAAGSNASRLYGKGIFFYNAQQKYGVNAILSLSLSRNETGNGRSNLAINKNNGFGLNAVDSNPYQSANWYASFASSILGYASKWITYGYAHPRDWRYYGPQFGDKYLGMNVKYASDAYWSEKMAANYYSFDKAKGLQDYNYYQLGIANKSFYTYSSPSTSSKQVYKYTEYGDSIVIVGYKDGWYEIVSDLNIDSNYNEITSGDYNWNQTVWAQSSDVTLINTGKNGYISPNSVTDYLDSEYTYDLMVQNTEFKPKVGYSLKTTDFYYDSTLQSKTEQKLVKNRYIMVHSIAYDASGKVVSYLVTSDYWHDQKHWVNADSITISNKAYGKSNVTASGNQYTWVNYNQQELESTIISGLFTNTYVPILEEKWVDGRKWYRVPVDISGTTNEFGWTLADIENVYIELYGTINDDNFPVINASNKTIVQGTDINLLDDVTANDVEDGIITSKVKIRSSNLNKDVVGTYSVVYEVTDTTNLTATKTIIINVIKNEKPVITAEDIEIKINETLIENVSATDKEDGDLTDSIKKINSTVDTTKAGIYEITYSVTDSYNQMVTKTIKVTVLKDEDPVINANDLEIEINSTFNELSEVTATDKEDGDLTKSIKVINNTVDTNAIGTYQVTYEVEDSYKNRVTKTITVSVVKELKLELVDGNFYLNYIKVSDTKLLIQGFQTIIGIDNTLDTDITYQIVFENINTGTEKIIRAERITSNIPKKVYSPDGKDYTYSWFNASIDIDNLYLGDYKMSVIAKTNKKYSKSVINNKVYKEQATYIKANNNNAIINNNYSSSVSFVEIKIRSELLSEKNSSYIYNQFDKYTKFEFTSDNKLHLRGNSYSYGMDLNANAVVERTLLFENTSNYKVYKKNIGSITTGNYKVILPEDDKLDKTRAWYDATIDISDIPVGQYVMYMSTKANINDIYELTEKLGRDLSNVTKTINNKKYSFTINKSRGNRIEMTVTE